MSRLYGRLQSDSRKTDATVGANESMECKLTWGSANNPRIALDAELIWIKGTVGPTLHIDIPDVVLVIAHRSGERVYLKPMS